ncbi:MAG: hypothetical protein U0T82_12765 [Bacteroidales bacterium]
MKQIFLSLILILAVSACTYSASRAGAGQDSTITDNSASPYFPPIMQQGYVGSCDWFAVAYYQMSYTRNRMLNKAYTPEETFSPKFGFTLINNGKDYPWNMWFVDVYELLKKHGCPFLPDCPYDAAEGRHYREWVVDSAVWRRAINNRIAGYESLTFDLNRVRALLRAGEVLVIQFNPGTVQYLKAMDNPLTGKDDAAAGEQVLAGGTAGPDHTVCMVGYNDHIWIDRDEDGKITADELGAFKIAESIGDGNVNKGFRWMSYAALDGNHSAILFENKLWRVFLRNNYQPRLIAQLCIEHAERGKLKMQLGRCAKADEKSVRQSTMVFDPYALGFVPGASGKSLIAGADFSFNGQEGMHEGCFSFDLTDMYEAKAEGMNQWFLRLENGSGREGRITAFRIGDPGKNSWINCMAVPLKLVEGENILFLEYPVSGKN